MRATAAWIRVGVLVLALVSRDTDASFVPAPAIPDVDGPVEPVTIPVPKDLDSVGERSVRRAVESAIEQVQAQRESALDWARLGHVYMAHGWDAEAAICYRRSADLEPAEGRWHYYFGRSLLTVDPARAALALGRAIERMPEYAVAHLFRARALRHAGALDDARAQFERALGFPAIERFAALGLGQLEADDGRHEQARKHLERALVLDPGQPDAHRALAKVCMALGDHEEANRHALAGQARRPSEALSDPLWIQIWEAGASARWFARRGAAHLARGDAARAAYELEKAVSEDPKDPGFWRDYGVALVRLGRNEEAVPALARVLDLQPTDGRTRRTDELDTAIHEQLGIAKTALGRAEEAEEHFERALSLSPDSPVAATLLAVLHAERGEVDKALELLERVGRSGHNRTSLELLEKLRAEQAERR